jgi:hypothetical protein
MGSEGESFAPPRPATGRNPYNSGEEGAYGYRY